MSCPPTLLDYSQRSVTAALYAPASNTSEPDLEAERSTVTSVVPLLRPDVPLFEPPAAEPEVTEAPVVEKLALNVSPVVSAAGSEANADGASMLMLKPLPVAMISAPPDVPPAIDESKAVKPAFATIVPVWFTLIVHVCVTVPLNGTTSVTALACIGTAMNAAAAATLRMFFTITLLLLFYFFSDAQQEFA